jgi:transcriptional regulator
VYNTKKGGEIMKQIDDLKILNLHQQGLLNKEIAKNLGCSESTVTVRLNKMGIKNIPVDKNKIEELHNSGLQDSEIAEILGCTRPNITHCLNKMGYTNRRSKINNIALRNKISESLIGRFVGETNPNYKGCSDIKTLARGLCKTLSRRLIRESNYTCECCKQHSNNLEIHHIKPFSIILNEFLESIYDNNITNLYSQLMSYPDFINEENLVVVCHDCHHKIHYTDNHELSPYRWESATTIESNT